MWDPQYYTNLSMTDMKHIFRGDDNNVIPRIFQRLVLLHDIGKILLESYKGKLLCEKILHAQSSSILVYSICM